MKQRQQVNFNTVDFRREHGLQPRGVAIWVFYFADAPSEPWIPRPIDAQIRRMSYTAAKDYATAEAIRRHVTAVRLDANPL